MQDSRILTKLGHTDLIAQDGMYHLSCLTKYYRRAASYILERKDDCNSSVDGTILAELVSHIEETRQEKETKVFKLSELMKLYQDRLKVMGKTKKGTFNSFEMKAVTKHTRVKIRN